MTYAEALLSTTATTKEFLVNPSDVLELVCFVLGISREQFYSTPSVTELTAKQIKELDSVVADYNRGKPLAYIIGYTEFLGNKVIIEPGVLIPRPETELLVEKFLNEDLNGVIHILEIGTGSGCIISSIAKALSDKKIKFTLSGIDPSPIAFKLTCLNVERNLGIKLNISMDKATYQDSDTRIKIVNKSIQEYQKDSALTHIISNPPYITSAEMSELDSSVKDFEPELALHAGSDGLNVYREIAEYSKSLPQLPKLYLEISPVTARDVEKLFEETGYTTEIQQDQFDRQRFLFGK